MKTSLLKGKKLNAEERLKIVSQVLEEKKPISWVCKQAGISQSLFYKLKKQYLEAGKGRREKLKVLEPKRKWDRRGKQLSQDQIEQILKVILKNPEYGITRILRQIYANNRRKIISYGGIQTLLLKLSLDSKRKRKTFVKWARILPKREMIELVLLSLVRYRAEEPLSPEERLKALRLVDDGVPIAQLCRSFNVSGGNFYKWQRRYNQAASGREYQAVSDREPMIERYWRQATERQVEAVLKIVVEHPEYSTHKVSTALAKIAGKPILGNHGVQNVFRRLGLNTYEKRLVYIQAQRPLITPTYDLLGQLRQLIGKIPVISAIPPPFKEKIAAGFHPFFLSFFSSIVFSTIFIYWLGIFAQAPGLGAKIGLFFASTALIVGSFFFAYSMKYYLTLAIVLSFSRQPTEEGGGYTISLGGKVNGRQKEKRSWLQQVFGLDNGTGERKELVQAGGLQPSLDHVKLKRYPFVSIHLPFYNEKNVAERILAACASIDYPNFEVIVCDDSNDGTTEIIRDYQGRLGKIREYQGEGGVTLSLVEPENKPTIKVIHRLTREGFKGGALKEALKAINPKTEFIVIFDADFIPYPDTIEQFLKYIKAAGGWEEEQRFDSEKIRIMPYETFQKVKISSRVKELLNQQLAVIRQKSNIACVAGYQWHVLNKSENWITRGVRTEYAGSYVIERPGQEILRALKIIHGSVYMIRADVLKHFGWGTSITEDFELTLRLYEKGFKVVYTPYVQAPSECVSTIKRLIRQRMRWSEGHSFNVRKMFVKLLTNPRLSLMEKLEFLYISPYYLQAFFFLVGTLSWLLAETVFRAHLPFWTSLWGWSLVLTNFFALPLMNAVGLFLEEAEEKDYLGILSFIALSYIMVPFQAYASLKGFLEKQESPWFRTPKTGLITDIFTRGRFYRWVSGILPRRQPLPVVVQTPLATNAYLTLTTANNQFNQFSISRKKRLPWLAKVTLALMLVFTTSLFYLSHNYQVIYATPWASPLKLERSNNPNDANGFPSWARYLSNSVTYNSSTNYIQVSNVTANSNSGSNNWYWLSNLWPTGADNAQVPSGWYYLQFAKQGNAGNGGANSVNLMIQLFLTSNNGTAKTSLAVNRVTYFMNRASNVVNTFNIANIAGRNITSAAKNRLAVRVWVQSGTSGCRTAACYFNMAIDNTNIPARLVIPAAGIIVPEIPKPVMVMILLAIMPVLPAIVSGRFRKPGRSIFEEFALAWKDLIFKLTGVGEEALDELPV